MMAKGHIYKIDLPNVRGFQFGDACLRCESGFELFDNQDRHIKFTLISIAPIPQEQINRMLQSIERVSNLPDVAFDAVPYRSTK